MKTKPNTMHQTLKTYLGQSLFEVIIAIGIAALVLVGAVSLSTASVRNSSFARNDSIATKFAQEGSEFLRQKRDSGWAAFITNYAGLTPPVCLGAGFLTGSGNCAIDSTYSRSLKFECRIYNPGDPSAGIPPSTSGIVGCGLTGVNIVNSYVIVSWTDGQGTHEVRDVTTLTRWH